MGQAKSRGTFEERKHRALVKIADEQATRITERNKTKQQKKTIGVISRGRLSNHLLIAAALGATAHNR